MGYLKSKRGRFIVGCAVVFVIASFNNSQNPKKNPPHYRALQLGTSISFPAPISGERVAVVLTTETAQDLKYSVKGPNGKEIVAKADTLKTKQRGFSFKVEQTGTHTLYAAYDCTDCSPGIGYATADIHKAGPGEFLHTKNQSAQ